MLLMLPINAIIGKLSAFKAIFIAQHFAFQIKDPEYDPKLQFVVASRHYNHS